MEEKNKKGDIMKGSKRKGLTQKEKLELVDLLALPKRELTLEERERERYLKRKMGLVI
jgi:hypothetical protein